jgi:hypothetical protein
MLLSKIVFEDSWPMMQSHDVPSEQHPHDKSPAQGDPDAHSVRVPFVI